jgi:hypothetical protein
MANGYKLRDDQIERLVRSVKKYSVNKNKQITTIDPVIKVAKNVFPTLTYREHVELSQITLRILLKETFRRTYQTTLFSHM